MRRGGLFPCKPAGIPASRENHKKMINCIIIVMDGIGDFDHDSRILTEKIEDLEHEGILSDVPVLKYSYSDDRLFQAFTEGMEAVREPRGYAYVWEDTQSPRYEEQHELYSKIETIVKKYL